MLRITDRLWIEENDLQFEFIQASGPGGQNVNKVATAVQLRFDVQNSPSLPGDIRQRLKRLAGKRINADGVLVIEARSRRTQEQNRQDALERLARLIRAAAEKPKRRIATKPSQAAVMRRLENKRKRGELKKLRRQGRGDDPE